MGKPLTSLESLLACGIVLATALAAGAAEKDARVYEMRIYYAADGQARRPARPLPRPHAASCSRSTA